MGIIHFHHLEKGKKLETGPKDGSKSKASCLEVDMRIENDDLLTSWLLGLMVKKFLGMIVGGETAFQMWSSLKEQLLPTTKEKEVHLTYIDYYPWRRDLVPLKNICGDSRHFVIALLLPKDLLMTQTRSFNWQEV